MGSAKSPTKQKLDKVLIKGMQPCLSSNTRQSNDNGDDLKIIVGFKLSNKFQTNIIYDMLSNPSNKWRCLLYFYGGISVHF